jgi:hypothetical protein
MHCGGPKGHVRSVLIYPYQHLSARVPQAFRDGCKIAAALAGVEIYHFWIDTSYKMLYCIDKKNSFCYAVLNLDESLAHLSMRFGLKPDSLRPATIPLRSNSAGLHLQNQINK